MAPAPSQIPTLVVVAVAATRFEGEFVHIDQKLHAGLDQYAAAWPGRTLVLSRSAEQLGNYANRARVADLNFEIAPLDFNSAATLGELRSAAVILASADDHRQLSLMDITPRPVVFIIEYTLATRIQHIWLGSQTPIGKAKTLFWTLNNERYLRWALRRAHGVQCNGKPALRAYGALNANSLLFFDTRATEDLVAAAGLVEQKVRQVMSGAPLRFAFSGRLETIKGADHLADIAKLLQAGGIAFRFDIFGDGSLRAQICRAIADYGLAGQVILHGPVDFAAELVPFMQHNVDLFICPHRQDDPSCTYLETIACGVPIIGYDNEAFEGVLELGPVGLSSDRRSPASLAAVIQDVDLNRALICSMMRAAATVGQSHTFERTFARRVAHLRGIANV